MLVNTIRLSIIISPVLVLIGLILVLVGNTSLGSMLLLVASIVLLLGLLALIIWSLI